MPALILLILAANPLAEIRNDSLVFLDGQRLRGAYPLVETTGVTSDGGTVYYTVRAKAAADGRYALLFEDTRFLPRDTFITRLTLFSAGRKKLRVESGASGRRIAFDLTEIFADSILLGTVNLDYTHPRLEMVPPKGPRRTVLPDSLFNRIIRVVYSPNRRYMVMHARKPSGTKLLDVIFSKDRETGYSWEYLFPICLTCRRSTIDLTIDDQGRVEAVYKNEHRIFSPAGEMIDIIIKMDEADKP